MHFTKGELSWGGHGGPRVDDSNLLLHCLIIDRAIIELASGITKSIGEFVGLIKSKKSVIRYVLDDFWINLDRNKRLSCPVLKLISKMGQPDQNGR